MTDEFRCNPGFCSRCLGPSHLRERHGSIRQILRNRGIFYTWGSRISSSLILFASLFWLCCNPPALKTGHNPFFFGKKTGCPETTRFFLVKKRVVWLGTDIPFFYQKKNGLLTLFLNMSLCSAPLWMFLMSHNKMLIRKKSLMMKKLVMKKLLMKMNHPRLMC